MGYDATADYKYPQWTADYDLDAGHVTVTAEETACTHDKNVTTTTVDATCTADGSVTVTCDDCGETISTEVLKSEGHKAGDKVTAVEPTYDAEGKWVINCKV
jgi:microcompartment protein CcmK/EutM